MDEIEKIPHTCSTCAFWVEAYRIEKSKCWVEWNAKYSKPTDTCEKWKDESDIHDHLI